MSIIRKYSYTDGTKSSGLKLNEEFDQVYANQNKNEDDTALNTIQVDSAIDAANRAESIANVADYNANNALSTANTAASNASAAFSIANDAAALANTASVAATNASTNSLNAQTAAQTAATQATEAANAVASKASVAYVDEIASNFTMGIILDGSLTDDKLSNDPGQIKYTVALIIDALDTHMSDGTVHVEHDSTLQTGLNSQMVNGVYMRNNAGALEWSTDNATWNAVGGAGIGSFEFGLPII